jgi:hypothetical protein
MRQPLRYLGPTTAQFRTGDVYLVLLAIDQERILLREPGNLPYVYRDLAHLLQFWQPVFPHLPVEGDDAGGRPADGSFT